jgi:uncharacterized membrane protein
MALLFSRGEFMPQNFYELLWIFMIYAFVGWCTEVSYAAVNHGVFVNRGFLNGPYCPIYGCGMVIVVGLLYPIKGNLLLLFIGSVLLTTCLEFVTGYVLEKVFHHKWWDYSKVPFNIKGYVCLKFSIYWGFGCTFVIRLVHPVIYRFVTLIPHILGILLITIVMLVFCVDVGITVATILSFNKKLQAMDEIAERIHKISDEIGERVYEKTTEVKDRSEELHETREELVQKIEDRNAEKKKELEELRAKYRALLHQRNYGIRRLLRAFPNMKSHDHGELLERIRQKIREEA